MLIPKQSISLIEIDGQDYSVSCYMVYDTDAHEFVENRTFSAYKTKEECQEAIDFYNSLTVVNVS